MNSSLMSLLKNAADGKNSVKLSELNDDDLYSLIIDRFNRAEDFKLIEKVFEGERLELISLDRTKGYVLFDSSLGAEPAELRNLMMKEYSDLYGRKIRNYFEDREIGLAGFYWRVV